MYLCDGDPPGDAASTFGPGTSSNKLQLIYNVASSRGDITKAPGWLKQAGVTGAGWTLILVWTGEYLSLVDSILVTVVRQPSHLPH